MYHFIEKNLMFTFFSNIMSQLLKHFRKQYAKFREFFKKTREIKYTRNLIPAKFNTFKVYR